MADRNRTQHTDLHPTVDQFADFLKQNDPPRRWTRWLLRGLLLIVALVLVAPTLVCRTPLKDYLISQAVPAEAGSVSIDSLRIGWLTPLSLSGVHVTDAQGHSLATIDQVTGDRSIIRMAQAPTKLGRLVVTRPQVALTLRQDGSNLEDFLHQLTASFDAPSEPPSADEETSSVAISADIQVIDAEVAMTEVESQNIWNFKATDTQIEVPADSAQDWKVHCQAALDGQPIHFRLACPVGQLTETMPWGPRGSVDLLADQISLSALRYAAKRTGQPVEHISGTLSAKLKTTWEASAEQAADAPVVPRVKLDGDLQLADFVLASPEYLGPDVLRLQLVSLESDLQSNGQQVELRTKLNSDVGEAALLSTVEVGNLRDPSALLQRLRTQNLEARGELDLAAITKLLPHTLTVQQDIHVASGRIPWSINSLANATGTHWSGELKTEGIDILRNGRSMDWQFPLQVQFEGFDGPEIRLEKLTASSFFFALSGQGTLREGQIHGKADLERLMYQLGQILDMNDVYLRGQLQTLLKWSETHPNHVAVDNRNRLTDFVMTRNEQVLCRETELDASAQFALTLDGQSIASLDTARCDVVAGQDFLVAELQQPVAAPSSQSTFHLAARCKGGLASWAGRLKTLGVIDGWQIQGDVDSLAQVSISPTSASIHSLTADLKDVFAATDGVRLQEPQVRLETSAAMDWNTGNCTLANTQFESATAGVSAKQLEVLMQPSFAVRGNANYRVDLGRLSSIMEVPSAADTVQSSQQPSPTGSHSLTGQSNGTLTFNTDGGITNFTIQGAVDELRVTDDAGQVTWYEPKTTLQAEGAYDGGTDALQLAKATIAGKAIQVNAAGRATDLSTNLAIDLSGDYGYDLAGLTQISRQFLGPDVELVGQQQHAFSARGPVFPKPPAQGMLAPEFTGQFQLGWQAANLYGVPLGPAQLEAVVQSGKAQMKPLTVAVGEGHVHLAPTLHLDSDAMWMTMPPGPLVDRVRLDPKMTSGWMKYVAPLMADAASVEGTFSVNLARTEVPLMDPTQGRLEGEVLIHGGALGPGPIAGQLLNLATQIKRLTGQGASRVADPSKSWVQLSEQKINFQLVEGRVYHRGFRMLIDGVPLETTGSVGIEDQSLEILAQVPVQDDWIASTPQLAGLRGQILSVPVRGTTSNPQLDQSALSQMTMQLARQGVTGYLQGELNEKLGNKLQGALGPLGAALLGGNANATQQPPAANTQPATQQPTQDIGTQLQDRAQREISKQLDRLFK